MVISKEKQKALQERMQRLEVREEDLVEKFILGSGRGGQKVQKSSTCVYLKHLPTGIEVKCQRDRSRTLNRYLARRELCERIEEVVYKKESERKKLADKIRRQKKRRSRRTQAKILEDKRRRGETKQLRKPPAQGDGL